jgi:heme/copper-type cytochrome/quinol oxidase subunit 2
MLAAFLDLLASTEKSAAEEGRDIVLAMLVVGLIFVLVIAIGELTHFLAHKRKERTPSRTL